MQHTPITIVVACDNHYIVLLAALVKSIELHNSSSRLIDLYIIGNNIPKRQQAKLEASVGSACIKMHWLKSADIIPQGMSIPVDQSAYPTDIYMRLFIPHFMPAGVETVLYLDVDMLVLHDVCELFSVKMDDHIVAAVGDPRVQTFDNSWGGIRNYKELGLDPKTRYFNTGLLLINLPKWRQDRITEKVFRCIGENKKNANYPDQYGLNIMLANQWKELDKRWNHFADTAAGDPYIIHFISRKPIYNSYSNQASFRQLFFTYLDQTGWTNFKCISETSRYLKITRNILAKRFLAFAR